MPIPVGDRIGTYALLRTSVILGLLAGFALSPKLWVSSRFYPLTPVWSFLNPFSFPADYVVLFALVALLLALIFAPRREIFAAVFVLITVLALQDQSRWQPWFYQYVFMLLAIALAGSGPQEAAFNTCCLVIAATYIWSGLAKLNPNFVSDIFPAFAEPFIAKGPAQAQWLVPRLAFVAPFLECAVGVGLLIRRIRPWALFCAMVMHAFILIALGPLGRSFNAVIWPWNLAMIAFLLILFFRRAEKPALRDIVWGRGFVFQKVVLILFGILPALSGFHLWDDYLSSALYSGNVDSGVIYLSDDAFESLPDKIEDYVFEEGPNLSSLDINHWSFLEMNVPAYPEARIFRNVTRQICGYVSNGSGVELVIQEKLALINGRRRLLYHCSDLQGRF
jgi:hypothetical protein